MTRVLGEGLAVDVWDAVAAELQQAELHMIVNNHVSKAVWCCSPDDGNG
ncbi:hypothetical protein BN1723_013190 [Verticillium longisporum]|uniref:Uncharacterized protein n=1 Tax=Verticillium longisporum TaxID=100787 RepID=A0A0G4LR92_VERLO|nr:hypothetical protein BN1723_013190 [Verticillium longisporum]